MNCDVGRKHTFRGGAFVYDPGGALQRGHKCETEGCENRVSKPRTLRCKSCAAKARAKRFYLERKTAMMCRVALCTHKRYGDSEYCIEHSGKCLECGVVTNFNSKRCPSCAQRQLQKQRRLMQEETSTARINELSRIISTYESSHDSGLKSRAIELRKQLEVEILCQSLTRLQSPVSDTRPASRPAIAERATSTLITPSLEHSLQSRSESESFPQTSASNAAA